MQASILQSATTTCETELQQECDNIGSGRNFFQLTTLLDNSQIWIFVVYGGAVINAIFFFLMWRIKELQVHPMKLFMYIMAADSLVLSQYSMSLNVCKLRLHTLYAATVFFDTSCESKLRAINQL